MVHSHIAAFHQQASATRFGSAMAISSNVIAIAEPPADGASSDTPTHVYVYHFDRAHFLETGMEHQGDNHYQYFPVLLRVLSKVGMGASLSLHPVSPTASTLAVSDDTAASVRVYKVHHDDVEAASEARKGWLAPDHGVHRVMIVRAPGEYSGSVMDTDIGHNLIAFSTRNASSDDISFGQVHATSFCDPGEMLQRTAYNTPGVKCSACPYPSTSQGGRSIRCVDCTQQTGVNCATNRLSRDGSTLFHIPMPDVKEHLEHGKEYQVQVRATTMAGTVHELPSETFVYDLTVCVVGQVS